MNMTFFHIPALPFREVSRLSVTVLERSRRAALHMFSIRNQEAWNPVSVFFLYNLGNITFHSGTKSPYLSNAFD